MSRRTVNIRDYAAKMPMAMVVIPFAVGIFFADAFEVPLWLLIALCVLSLVGVVILSKWWRVAAIATMTVATGALLHSLSYRAEVEYNKPLDMELDVATSSALRRGYTSAEAKILACEDATLVGRKVVLWGDSLIRFVAGDRLRLTTPIRPFRAEQAQYAGLMYHRGFVGAVSVNHRTTYEYVPTEGATLHEWAVARLQGSLPASDARSVVLAMATGERRELSSELRQSYSASGASHLLAVSGLHIGIAFMLVNLLLYPLVLLRYGNVWRSVGAVIFIWLYVWLCGVSPSAVRAAAMFSLLQLSLSSLREYVGINILAATAFAMLVFDSHLLFDISFQLSFVAVAGILLWAMPLYRLCATRFKLLNAIIGILWVGVASTLITMPLVANTFSVVSLVGILINPIVILLANIIVLAGIVALVVPIVGVVAELAAEVQNGVVAWAESLPYGHFEITISDSAMWGVYALFVVATIVGISLFGGEKKREIEI